MATINELTDVVKDTLASRGVLGQLQARIRAEVYNALDNQDVPKPKLPNENLLINELIREYCEYNNYKYTQSVLLAESGQPQRPLGRKFLMDELNIAGDSFEPGSGMPLLYSMLAYFMKIKPRHESPGDAKVFIDKRNIQKNQGSQGEDDTFSNSPSHLAAVTISNDK